METEKNSSFKISEGALIALIPFTGYITAFCYELSYSNVFQYPFEYISLTIESILFASFSVALLLFLIYYLLALSVSIFKKSSVESSLGRFLVINILIFVIWAVILIMGGSVWVGWVVLGSFFLMEFVRPLLIPFFDGRSFPNYTKRFEIERTKISDYLTFISVIRINLTAPASSILISIAVLCSFALALGTNIAKNEEYFFIIKDNPTKVVLRINADHFIIGEIDTLTKIINNYSLISSTGALIEYKHIGVLRPINSLDSLTTIIKNDSTK